MVGRRISLLFSPLDSADSARFFVFVMIVYRLFCRDIFRFGRASCVTSSVRSFNIMVDAKLEAVPPVEIDEGIFKYVLIKVYGKEKSDGSEPSKNIVRGLARANWHSDIYDEVSSSLEGLGLATECLGGGRIEHRADRKWIKIYGYSQGYGKADHQEARRILLTQYSGYEIETSDEGY